MDTIRPCGRATLAMELLEPQPDDAILDVGCNEGYLETELLAGRARRIVGVDVDPASIDRARARRPDLQFECSPAEELPFAEAEFDRLLCLDVFEHVQDERRTAAEITRVLRPGGRLVLSVPHAFLDFLDPERFTPRLKNALRRLRGQAPTSYEDHRHYSVAALTDFFPDFRFDTVHVGGTPLSMACALFHGHVPLPARWKQRARRLTAPLEDLDYRLRMPARMGLCLMVSGTRLARDRHATKFARRVVDLGVSERWTKSVAARRKASATAPRTPS